MMSKSSIASKKLRAQDGSLVKNQSTEMRVTRSKDGKQLTQHSCIPASTAEAIIGPGSAPQIVSRMTEHSSHFWGILLGLSLRACTAPCVLAEDLSVFILKDGIIFLRIGMLDDIIVR